MIIKRAEVVGIRQASQYLFQARLKDFADNDPAVMEQMVQETKDALEATNR